MRISDWSSDVCSSDLLYVDNIMDLSHTDHLHADTLGGGGVVFNKPKVTSTDEWIEVAWQSRSTRPPAFYPRMIPNLPELVDLTLRVRWFAASDRTSTRLNSSH